MRKSEWYFEIRMLSTSKTKICMYLWQKRAAVILGSVHQARK